MPRLGTPFGRAPSPPGSEPPAVRFGVQSWGMFFEVGDLATIGLLVLLEAILSADNALVLAVLVLGLPPEKQKKALRYGILGAFAFRVVATTFAVYLMAWEWVKLLGGLYLLYLGIPIVETVPQERGFLFASAVVAVCLVILIAIMGASVILWDMGAAPEYIN